MNKLLTSLILTLVTFTTFSAAKYKDFPEGLAPFSADLLAMGGDKYIISSNTIYEDQYLGYMKFGADLYLRSDKKVTWAVERTGLFTFKLRNTFNGRDGKGDKKNGHYVAISGGAVKLVKHKGDANDLTALFKEDGSDGFALYLTAANTNRYLNGELKKVFIDNKPFQRFRFELAALDDNKDDSE